MADKRFFQGLASPEPAAFIAGSIWSENKYGVEPTNINYIAAIITTLPELLMVSNSRYHPFKEVDLQSKVNFFRNVNAYRRFRYYFCRTGNDALLMPLYICTLMHSQGRSLL